MVQAWADYLGKLGDVVSVANALKDQCEQRHSDIMLNAAVDATVE